MEFLKAVWARIMGAITYVMTIRNLGSTPGHRKLTRGQVGAALTGSIASAVPASYALLVTKTVEATIGVAGMVHGEKGHERLAAMVLTALALSYVGLGLYVRYSDTDCPYDPTGDLNVSDKACWTLGLLDALFNGLAAAWFGKSEFFKDSQPPGGGEVLQEPQPQALELANV